MFKMIENWKFGDIVFFDVESYPNLFSLQLKNRRTAEYLKIFNHSSLNLLGKILSCFTLVGFNSKAYDQPMVSKFLTTDCPKQLNELSDALIVDKIKRSQYGFRLAEFNHIDLMPVAPLSESLKKYGARLCCENLQDLPYPPGTTLTDEQKRNVVKYCDNDLDLTNLLYDELEPELEIRIKMSEKYGIDLRSKSDAQIAEHVIASEYSKITSKSLKYNKPDFDNLKGKVIKYKCPNFIYFSTPKLKNLLEEIKEKEFILDSNGKPNSSFINIEFDGVEFCVGMGGIHSKEKSKAHIETDEVEICDIDAASFYPYCILNQKLYPENIGVVFLDIYENIVKSRIYAKNKHAEFKKQGDLKNAQSMKDEADTLKIVINGLFGKFGSAYSRVYSPDLMLQVTISGQLCLLMLIEAMSFLKVKVINANTDGIVIKYNRINQKILVDSVIERFQEHCQFKMEKTYYEALYSRDVSNYIALKKENGDQTSKFVDRKLAIKAKGAFAFRGSALDSVLSKNVEFSICIEALLFKIKKNIDVETTIRNCKDVTKFLAIREVRGGGEFRGVYVGKIVRFYISKQSNDSLIYTTSKNKVANSDNCVPMMKLLKDLPEDLNYSFYIQRAEDMLFKIGYMRICDLLED